MFCLTPTFLEEPNFGDYDTRDGFVRLQYGFVFDTVNYTALLQGKDDDHQFQLYPNPQYEPFDEKVKKYKSDYLTINVSITVATVL
jgi:plexin A